MKNKTADKIDDTRVLICPLFLAAGMINHNPGAYDVACLRERCGFWIYGSGGRCGIGVACND